MGEIVKVMDKPQIDQAYQDQVQDDDAAAQAEAKRRSARRRFLTGGIGAGAAVVTLGARRSYAASLLTCLSKGGEPRSHDKGLSDVECDF